MLDKIVKLKNGLRTHGFKYLLLCLSWRLPKWAFSYDHVLLYVVTDLRMTHRDRSDVCIRLVSPADASKMEPLGVSRELVLSRLEHGDSCAAVFRGNEALSMEWAATGKMFVKASGAVLDTENDSFYIYNGFTLPSERSKGFLIACNAVLFDHYRQEGRTSAVGAISVFNSVSIKVQEKSGFIRSGETVRIILMGVSFLYTRKWPSPCPRLQIGLLRHSQELRVL